MVVEVDHPAEEWRRDILADLLSEISGRGVEEDDACFRVYLPLSDDTDAEAATSAVSAAVRGVLPGSEDRCRFWWQPHEDWVDLWRQGVEARKVTPRLVVSPTWDPYIADGDEIVIHLDPGVAFGTAEHATTRGCLRLLERHVRPFERIGDLGSGSGILAIAAAKLGADAVLAVDSDPLACGAASENVERNDVADRVTVREGLVDPAFLATEGPFDGIVANIETGVLLPLVPHLSAALFPGGWMILSGIQAHEATDIVETAVRAGLSLGESDEEPGWWSGAFRSP